jgi:hypothetical protein
MSYTDVWNALADRFEDAADDAPIELANYPEDARDFDWEVLRSRVLFRYREDEQVQTERLFSIRADGPEPQLRRRRVNRFRWLCHAAGVLLDPHAWYRCGEVVWFDHLSCGEHDTIPDVARLSADAARELARRGQSPPPQPAPARPDWWTHRRRRFRQFARRFSAPLFHGSTLRMTIGQNRLPGDDGHDPDFHGFDWERRDRRGQGRGRLTFHSDTGGSIWGDWSAVREFTTIAENAVRSLPAELTIGMGPPLFPPVLLSSHTDLGPAWYKWGVVMWALSPSDFTIEFATDRSNPVITAGGCLETIAANVCQIIAATEDCQTLKRNVRLQLAGGNPWLNHDDRRAARRAIEAAYSVHHVVTARRGNAGRHRNGQRGRPKAVDRTPGQMRADVKLYQDWKASKNTKRVFLRSRRIPEEEGLKQLDRGKYHATKGRKKMPV